MVAELLPLFVFSLIQTDVMFTKAYLKLHQLLFLYIASECRQRSIMCRSVHAPVRRLTWSAAHFHSQVTLCTSKNEHGYGRTKRFCAYSMYLLFEARRDLVAAEMEQPESTKCFEAEQSLSQRTSAARWHVVLSKIEARAAGSERETSAPLVRLMMPSRGCRAYCRFLFPLQSSVLIFFHKTAKWKVLFRNARVSEKVTLSSDV